MRDCGECGPVLSALSNGWLAAMLVAKEKTKIWIISLADAGRTAGAVCEPGIRALHRRWEFFDAHTQLAPLLRHVVGATRSTHGRTLRGGELGCYSSHWSLWRWLVESDCEQMIVLEDDVQVDWRFIDFISGINFADMNINYLRLFAKIPARWRYVATPFLDRYHHLIRFTGYALGTQAYLLTKAGAAQLLATAWPNDPLSDRYFYGSLLGTRRA